MKAVVFGMVVTLASLANTTIQGSDSKKPKPANGPAPVFWGISYGPYRENQSPTGVGPTEGQIRADMSRLAALSSRIRTYSLAGNQAKIPQIAHAHHLKTWVGAWIGPNLAENEVEIERLFSVAAQPSVEAVIVGNEVLYRKYVTPEQLVSYIKQVKSRVSVPVAYAEGWFQLYEHPEVVAEVDIVMVHIHPYWHNVPADKGSEYLMKHFQDMQAHYPDKKVVIGETGWPAAGSGKAVVASPEQQRIFLNGLVDVQKKHPELQTFLFEAFDEKFQEEQVQWHWGIYNSDGSTKAHLLDLIPFHPPDPARVAGVPGVILDRGLLSPGFYLHSVTSSGVMNSWATTDAKGLLRCVYPGGQKWGSVVFTAGRHNGSKIYDCSNYSSLVLDVKGARGGERVRIGVRTDREPADGREPMYRVQELTANWQTIRIPLSDLVQEPDYPANRLSHLHTVCELIFPPNTPETIFIRNVEFSNEEGLPASAYEASINPVLLIVGCTLLAWMLLRLGFALVLSRGSFRRVILARQVGSRVLREPAFAEQAALLLRPPQRHDDASQSEALLTLVRREGPELLKAADAAERAAASMESRPPEPKEEK